MTMELNKPLKTHEHIVSNSWDIFSMSAPNLYGVIVVLSGDVVNSIFHITLIILVKGLPMDLCNTLDFITTGLNEK